MLIVADSTPLNFIIRLGHAEILFKLFEQVLIPPEVKRELTRERTPAPVRDFIEHRPDWLRIVEPQKTLSIPCLDLGEIKAISLAVELGADLLLIDERDGRREAQRHNIPIAGTIGVFERAAKAGLLDLKKAFDQLRNEPNFHAKHLLDKRLEDFMP